MAASIQFDQVGLPAGTPGQARSDGLDTGAKVTVTNASGQPCRCEFWWKPPDDSSAALVQILPHQWEFTPEASRYGEYIVRMIEDEGTVSETEDIKAFGIRLPVSNLLIPGLNSRGDFDVNLASDGTKKALAALIAFQNEPLPDDATIDYANWWQSQHELYKAMESAVAGAAVGLKAIIWDPDIGEETSPHPVDTIFRKKLFEDCVAALTATDGYGVVILNHDEQISTISYEIAAGGIVDLEKRIGILNCNFQRSDPTNVRITDSATQIESPWFVKSIGDAPLEFKRIDQNDTLPTFISLSSGRYTEFQNVVLKRTTLGEAPFLRFGSSGPSGLDDNVYLKFVDCQFPDDKVIQFEDDIDKVEVRFVGDRTVLTANDLFGATGVASVGSGNNVTDFDIYIDASESWTTQIVGGSWDGAAATFQTKQRRFAPGSSMIVGLLNSGVNAEQIRHDVGLDKVLYSEVPLTALGPGTNFLADDGSYKALTASVALDPKESVRVVETGSNVTLSGLTTIDGIALNAGDRVLLTAQSSGIENGIWEAQVGAWTRPADFAAGTSAAGVFMFVEEGFTFNETMFLCATNEPNDIVDTDPLAFIQYGIVNFAHVGTGAEIFRDKVGNTANFRRVQGEDGITAAVDGDSLDVRGTDLLPLDGSRAMTGNLDMGANDVTNVNLVDGVDVSAHATRHQDGGADEINVAGLSGVLADAQLTTVRLNGGADVGSRPRVNFIEGTDIDIVVADDGVDNEIDVTINSTASGGGTDRLVIPIEAEDFDLVEGGDWLSSPSNTPAQIANDSNNGALRVAVFPDTTPEAAVGWQLGVPSWATSMTIRTWVRAETAPGAAEVAVFTLFEREIPDNAAITAWSAETQLPDLNIPTNELWQLDSVTDTLANWGLTAGSVHQFVLTRDTPDPTDTLSGDLNLLRIEVEFT